MVGPIRQDHHGRFLVPAAVSAYAASSATSPLAPFTIERRDPGSHDVVIDIDHCGICHTDLHLVRNEWGRSRYPMVPGHEIVGRVSALGSGVTSWRVGERVGIGCFVDSCRTCESCRDGEEQFCLEGAVFTYNGTERGTNKPTLGGYSKRIVVDEHYVLRIPEGLAPDAAAPLLCAGITTYSPLKRFGAAPGRRVAVLGLGGLGHMGVKFARALGAEVTVLSHSSRKRADALRMGAHEFVVTEEAGTLAKHAGRFDLVLDTVSAPHAYGPYLELLRRDGTMAVVGIPPQPEPLAANVLVTNRRRLVGSLIGGIRETQEMLDFSARHGLAADIEGIAIAEVNTAYERLARGDVRYRFVIDLATLA
jgi:uncharacterized zinc-type alcohol dehydrogenase-like protein